MALVSWKQGFVTEGRCQLEYFTHSAGAESGQREWVLFLHGFGQDYRAMEPLAELYTGRFNLLSLNFFFHGASTLEDGLPLEPQEWKLVVVALFHKLGIETVHAVGFSMGCKFGLLTAQLLPERISSLALLAPDGMVQNPWYRFATQSAFGRMTLRMVVRWLPFFRLLTVFFAKTSLIRASLGRFAEHEMGSRQRRDRVLNVWLRFRKIWPDWEALPGFLAQHQIPVHIILGKFDTIIPTSKFEPRWNEWMGFQWTTLKAGHANLVNEVAKEKALFPFSG